MRQVLAVIGLREGGIQGAVESSQQQDGRGYGGPPAADDHRAVIGLDDYFDVGLEQMSPQ